MNKGELVSAIAEKSELTKVNSEKALQAFMDIVKEQLATGDDVILIGFGTFKVAERAAREGRNPQTGAKLQIAAKKVVKFSPGKALEESVNADKAKKKAPAKSKKC
jgi:DNA-binding protein HU-beta